MVEGGRMVERFQFSSVRPIIVAIYSARYNNLVSIFPLHKYGAGGVGLCYAIYDMM